MVIQSQPDLLLVGQAENAEDALSQFRRIRPDVTILLGVALVLGAFTRVAAFLSGWLLLLFALSMTFALRLKAPLNFSVFTASAAAFLLATCRKYSWSLDSLRKQPKRNPTKMQTSMPAIILMT